MVNELRHRHPELWVSVSATTRPARPGEVDGKHYHFRSAEQFDELHAEDGFLEWALVHGVHRYGTLAAPVDEQLAEGGNVLLEVDLQGARQIKESRPHAVLVFLAPPSFEDLITRLVGRGTEGAEERERRLQTARVELAAQDEFDVVIINDTVEQAVGELEAVMGL